MAVPRPPRRGSAGLDAYIVSGFTRPEFLVEVEAVAARSD